MIYLVPQSTPILLHIECLVKTEVMSTVFKVMSVILHSDMHPDMMSGIGITTDPALGSNNS